MKKLLALALAVMMVLALCACGSSSETAAPAAEAAPAAADGEKPADAPEGAVTPPEGAELGDPTGEPVAELFPTDGYSKDFEGYKQYAIDALRSDEHAPADIVEMTVETLNAATDGDDDAFAMLVNQGRILSYADFIG